MDLQVLKLDGTKSSKVKVADDVFKIQPNESVVHQAVVTELKNSRQGTAAAKTRGMVSGGGKKPFKQKGRGAARAGSSRSPVWVGGGTVFGPQPINHSMRINKKMKALARKSVLSLKAASGSVFVVEDLKMDSIKTKDFVKMLEALGLAGKKLAILPGAVDTNLALSARNVPEVVVFPAAEASTYDLIDCEALLFDKSGITILDNLLSKKDK